MICRMRKPSTAMYHLDQYERLLNINENSKIKIQKVKSGLPIFDFLFFTFDLFDILSSTIRY